MTIKRFSFLLLISLIIFPILAVSGNIIYEHFSSDNTNKEATLEDSEYSEEGGCYYGQLESGAYEMVCS